MTDLQCRTLEILELMTDVFVIYELDVIGAIVILIFGWMAFGWGRVVVQKALAKTSKVDSMVQVYVSNSAKYAIFESDCDKQQKIREELKKNLMN